MKTDLKIAESVVLHRSYPQAPVSSLCLFGKAQDVAFEKQVGGSPDKRHHVRFWRTEIPGDEKRHFWIGSVTMYKSIGLGGYTGKITHHIDADIYSERDGLMGGLSLAEQLVKIYQVTGVGPMLNGRNAG